MLSRTGMVNQILTERLWLLQLDVAQARNLLEGRADSERPWMRGYPIDGSLVAAEAFLRTVDAGIDPGPYGMYQLVRRADSVVVGDIGFHAPPDPGQLAAAAREAVAAGAAALHVHQRAADGSQTLAAEPCARVLRAIRSACPGVPGGRTTGAWIEPDPDRRLDLVARWEVAPDYASVNLSEDGAVPLLRLLLDRGIGVEAGVWTVADAEKLLASGLADGCLRVLLEAMEAD